MQQPYQSVGGDASSSRLYQPDNGALSDYQQWSEVLGTAPGYAFSVYIILFTLALGAAGGAITLVGMFAALYMMYTLFNYVKSHQHSEVTLAALIRYFNWACTLLLAYLIGMIHWSFMSCYALVFLISLYFFCSAETYHEGFLKFFFIFPLEEKAVNRNDHIRRNETWTMVSGLSECDWYLWLSRLVFMSLALGSSASSLGKITVGPEAGDHAISAFLSAGFCEELYKFLFTGTISAISMYSSSRVAILQLSVGSAAGFTLMEDILYAMNAGVVTLMIRLLFFPLHICFNQVCALGVARQRPSLQSKFEIVFFFFSGVTLHGLYDYMLFLDHPSWIFLVSICVIAPCTCFSGYRVWTLGLSGLSDPDLEPKPSSNNRRIVSRASPRQPNQPLLPSGWEARIDSDGRTMYMDILSENTQYNFPSAQALPDPWRYQRTASGEIVFIDSNGFVHDRPALLSILNTRDNEHRHSTPQTPV